MARTRHSKHIQTFPFYYSAINSVLDNGKNQSRSQFQFYYSAINSTDDLTVDLSEATFQFYYSAINSPTLTNFILQKPNFNSTIVQLIVFIELP